MFLWEYVPAIFLEIWGTIRPMNPIIPLTDTHILARKEIFNINFVLSLFISIPKEWASSSDSSIMSYFFRLVIIKGITIDNAASIIKTSL